MKRLGKVERTWSLFGIQSYKLHDNEDKDENEVQDLSRTRHTDKVR